MINLSVRDELNSLILRTRREFEVCVWVPTPEGSFVVYAGKKYLSYVFFKLKLIAISAT